MLPLRNRLLARITAPTSEPVSLAEAKNYLRVDHTLDDNMIYDLIVAGRMNAEQWLKRSLITQSWKLAYDDYIGKETALPMGPVSAITSVVAVNRDTTTQTISSNVYTLNAAKDMLLLDSRVYGFRIEITYVTGYGDALSVPKPIKYGILSHIAAMYDSRGEMGMKIVPEQAMQLYMPFREVRI